MASPSSPQKSADTLAVEVVARLLRSGSQHDEDRPEIARTVQHLRSLGLIDTTSAEYVRCAESRDRDYQYVRDRSCRGLIRLNAALDEDGDSFHCPECGRAVYPRHKKRFKMLQVEVKPDKVAAFLDGIIAESDLPRKQLQPWVWRVDTPQGEAKLVVVDYCGGQEVASRDWALNTRVCYIVVDAANCKNRFLPEKWLAWARLADIVCQPDLLPKLLSFAAGTVPSPEARVSVPVYSATVPPVVIGTPPPDDKTPAPKKLKKRATRAAAIDAIKQALREHLRAARDHAYSSRDGKEGATLLPRPTLQQLADQLKVHISSVSRAINDSSDKEIAILWDAANDIEKVKRFKG
jgi:predicted RNA-binding Zn-ribbon protein involved in translation (DUF1610 family)